MMSKFKSIKHTFSAFTHAELLKFLPFECAYYPNDDLPERADPDTLELAMILSAVNYTMKPYATAEPPLN